jgi:hypothetical protein
MPFSVVAAGVGLAGSLLKGGSQSSAISSGQQQANAAVAPYQTQGTNALTDYANLEGLNGSAAATTAMGNFTASPGYQYDVSQGLRAVDAGAAGKGILRSGATLKAEQTLGNNLADQDFSNYTNRLSNLAGMGLSASTNVASTDTAAAGQQASIYGNTTTGLSSGVTTALGSSGVQNTLSGLWSGGGTTDQGTWDT